MIVQARVSCPIHDSFRVQQVAGMFDVTLAERAAESFTADVPDLSEDWRIGAIVGPSGSGKSTIARHAFEHYVVTPEEPRRLDHFAIIDCLAGDVRGATEMLTQVGLSSPPAWVKPCSALSTGQQFRFHLARELRWAAECKLRLCVFDEFTSVVDRTVARVGSLAVQKYIRGLPPENATRFVAVTCHYDVLDWLQPDWVLDMATGETKRRCLWRRPPVELEIVRCAHDAWRLFAPHHYLSGNLNRSAKCYLATWNGEPVAFAGLLSAFGRSNSGWRVSRIVVLPDYQGIGIGGRFLDAVADLASLTDESPPRREKVTIVTTHPAMISHCQRSPRWRCHGVRKLGQPVSRSDDLGKRSARATRSYGRPTASFTLLHDGDPPKER